MGRWEQRRLIERLTNRCRTSRGYVWSVLWIAAALVSVRRRLRGEGARLPSSAPREATDVGQRPGRRTRPS
jgi:hypothetical protein